MDPDFVELNEHGRAREYGLAMSRSLFGGVIAPMEELTDAEQKAVWHDGEQVERLDTSNLGFPCPKNGGAGS